MVLSMTVMKTHQDRVLESITASLEAMTRMVELAKSSGIYDGKIAESAYLCIEAGLKLSQFPVTCRPILTEAEKQTARAFLQECEQFFDVSPKSLLR